MQTDANQMMRPHFITCTGAVPLRTTLSKAIHEDNFVVILEEPVFFTLWLSSGYLREHTSHYIIHSQAKFFPETKF